MELSTILPTRGLTTMSTIIDYMVIKLKYRTMKFKNMFSLLGSGASYRAIDTESILVTTSSGTYAMEVAR